METVAVVGARAQFQPGDAVLLHQEQPGPPGEHTPLSPQDRNCMAWTWTNSGAISTY